MGKTAQKDHWDGVAAGWDAWFAWTERNFRPLTEWLHGAAGWAPGRRILDVASGAGYPALSAAAAVRPGGFVVAADISTQMLAVASRRAHAAGLDNMRFVEMDAEELTCADESFDAVLNTYGLMFCADPPRAVREACRVLRPGGRVALVTWDDPARNPFFTVIAATAAAYLGIPRPAAGAAGPFRLANPDALEALLRGSGCAGVTVESRAMTFECESVAEYCRLFGDVAWKTRIAALPDDEAAAFREAVSEAAAPYLHGGRLRLTATSLCASGRKPA